MGLLSNQSVTSGRILVVDDDPGARDLMVASLRADGHDVDSSSNGLEALRMVGRQWYDLIVSDLKMPGLDGPDLYNEITRRWPIGHPHVLFVSAFGSTADYDGFLKVIKAPVLAKPFKVGDLRRAVRRLL
jgi:DNA-binding response OmpR family regulator